MYGIEGLDHRVGRLSESLQIIKSLWTEERTNFDGRYYKMTDAINDDQFVALSDSKDVVASRTRVAGYFDNTCRTAQPA